MKKRERIEINPSQAGLNSAFASLAVENLAPAPVDAPRQDAPAPRTRLGRVLLRRETVHRGGKAVLVVHDFAADITDSEIEALARRLRTACGCGGTHRERTIELQGEPIAKVRAFLEEAGFQVAGVR